MTTATMDPRIRARRIGVARDAGRRRLNRLVWLVGLVAILASAWMVTRSPLLDVDRVNVGGAERTSVLAVKEASGLELGAPMLDIDEAAVTRAIMTLPWVDEVSFSRSWPGTIQLNIAERTPVAMLVHPNSTAADPLWALVDTDGRVLATTGEAMVQLPRLSVTQEVVEPGSAMSVDVRPAIRVAERLPATVAAELDTIVLRDDGSILLEFVSGGSAEIGTMTQLEEKFLAVLAMFESSPDMATRDIDVRVPHTPVLLAAETAEAPETSQGEPEQ
ncbi:MAG: cell division protein FtsQ/DivIB [Acidimicrobiales bacterium]